MHAKKYLYLVLIWWVTQRKLGAHWIKLMSGTRDIVHIWTSTNKLLCTDNMCEVTAPQACFRSPQASSPCNCDKTLNSTGKSTGLSSLPLPTDIWNWQFGTKIGSWRPHWMVWMGNLRRPEINWNKAAIVVYWCRIGRARSQCSRVISLRKAWALRWRTG